MGILCYQIKQIHIPFGIPSSAILEFLDDASSNIFSSI